MLANASTYSCSGIHSSDAKADFTVSSEVAAVLRGLSSGLRSAVPGQKHCDRPMCFPTSISGYQTFKHTCIYAKCSDVGVPSQVAIGLVSLPGKQVACMDSVWSPPVHDNDHLRVSMTAHLQACLCAL